MHPYFWTQVQPFQTFNPTDIGMAQRPLPWFDPNAYQTTYNPLTYRSAYPGFEANPYYTGILPRAVFQMPNPFISPEIGRGVPPVSFAGFGPSEYLSPENFLSGPAKTAELPPP